MWRDGRVTELLRWSSEPGLQTFCFCFYGCQFLIVVWRLSLLLLPLSIIHRSFSQWTSCMCNAVLLSPFGLTWVDSVDTKSGLINQVVRWVWGLAHSLPSQQGGPHPEGNAGHTHSLAHGSSQSAEHFISGDFQELPNGEHSCKCDDSGIWKIWGWSMQGQQGWLVITKLCWCAAVGSGETEGHSQTNKFQAYLGDIVGLIPDLCNKVSQ